MKSSNKLILLTGRTLRMNHLKVFAKVAVLSTIILTVISCRPREGTLIISTYPVPGAVIVDDKLYKEIPVTLNLKPGEHEVAFTEYSEQYITPPTEKVPVISGESNVFVGVYRNRFTPDKPAIGFPAADSIRIYGTRDRKLKDGTIFDYINGGGVVYLKHGLRETSHMVYRDRTGTTLTVDIYDMGSFENAQPAFENEDICPPGFMDCSAGEGCKAYSYEPDFLLYFYKSKYLVYVSTNNDSIRGVVESCASIIDNNISGSVRNDMKK